jgi:hypothetical protein
MARRGRSRVRSAFPVVSFVAVFVCLAACDGRSDPSPDPGPPSSTSVPGESSSPASAGTSIATDPSRCVGAWTQPLTVQAQFAAEVQYLSKMSACTTAAGDETGVINDTDIVWDIYTTQRGSAVVHASPSWKQSIFRASIPSGHFAVVEPGSSVSVHASPAETSWFADPALTGVWQSQAALIQAAEDEATEQVKGSLPELFSPQSQRGQAWVACGLAVYDAASATVERYNEGLDAQGVPSLIEDAQGLGQSADDCREKLAAADEADVAERRIATPTLAEAERVASDAGWVARAEESFHGAAILRARLHFHL